MEAPCRRCTRGRPRRQGRAGGSAGKLGHGDGVVDGVGAFAVGWSARGSRGRARRRRPTKRARAARHRTGTLSLHRHGEVASQTTDSLARLERAVEPRERRREISSFPDWSARSPRQARRSSSEITRWSGNTSRTSVVFPLPEGPTVPRGSASRDALVKRGLEALFDARDGPRDEAIEASGSRRAGARQIGERSDTHCPDGRAARGRGSASRVGPDQSTISVARSTFVRALTALRRGPPRAMRRRPGARASSGKGSAEARGVRRIGRVARRAPRFAPSAAIGRPRRAVEQRCSAPLDLRLRRDRGRSIRLSVFLEPALERQVVLPSSIRVEGGPAFGVSPLRACP